MLKFFFYNDSVLFEDVCRISNYRTVVGNILEDYRSRSDGAVVSYCYPTNEYGSRSDFDVFSDSGSFAVFKSAGYVVGNPGAAAYAFAVQKGAVTVEEDNTSLDIRGFGYMEIADSWG